jgi:3-hydroxyisobutyrate dehydrogenase
MNTSRIGIVGVGRMGANMARRLKDRGFVLTAIYDVDATRAQSLAAELGAVAPTSLAALTAAADIVLTVVTDDAAMQTIFFDPTDSLLADAAGRVFLNCATLSPQMHLAVDAACARAGASALECCMASSITQAREGSLYLMIGGNRAVYEQTLPVLEALSTSPRYVGEAGEAAKVKALVNMVMNINTAGLAEGLGLADALGLDLNMIREVFAQTGAASRVLVTDGEDMQNRDHTCYFSVAHAAKDSGIALALAGQTGLSLPLAAAATAQFERMQQLGLGELDKSGIAELTFLGRSARPA